MAGLAALLALGLTPSIAAENKAALGRVMWSSFQCATFAEMSGRPDDQKRLFTLAFQAGRSFLQALEQRQITPEAISKHVPIGVTMLLGGPSHDFIIGRIFENAMQDAFDSVVKKDRNGVLLPIDSWVRNDELKRTIATTKYQAGNCSVIR